MTPELWFQIADFPLYEVSNRGEIRRLDNKKPVAITKNQFGALKVNLYLDGISYTKTVRMLVALAFVKGRDSRYNTAVVIDGDQSNLNADNLMWRPRWFANNYSLQINEEVYRKKLRGYIVNINTGDRFSSIAEAAMYDGVLPRDIMHSCVSYELPEDDHPVFPFSYRYAYRV